ERLILQLLRKVPAHRGQSAEAALEVLGTVSENTHETSAETSAVLARLQEGASALMRETAAREAEEARTHQALRETHERSEAALRQLEDMLMDAAALVEQSVAPLTVRREGMRGNWRFTLEQSPRQVSVQGAPPLSEALDTAANAPGKIVLFGHIA